MVDCDYGIAGRPAAAEKEPSVSQALESLHHQVIQRLQASGRVVNAILLLLDGHRAPARNLACSAAAAGTDATLGQLALPPAWTCRHLFNVDMEV